MNTNIIGAYFTALTAFDTKILHTKNAGVVCLDWNAYRQGQMLEHENYLL